MICTKSTIVASLPICFNEGKKLTFFMSQKSIFLAIKWGTVCFGFLFSNAFTSRKINTDDSKAAVRQVVKLVERASKRHKGWDTTTATSTNATTLF